MYCSYPNLLNVQTPNLSLLASDFIALATETLEADGSHLSTTKSKSTGVNRHWPYSPPEHCGQGMQGPSSSQRNIIPLVICIPLSIYI